MCTLKELFLCQQYSFVLKKNVKLCGYPATEKLLTYIQGFIPRTGYSSDFCTDENYFARAKFLSRNGE